MSNRRAVVCIKDACQIAGVTRRTMYNWLAANKVEYVRTAGGAVRIFTDSLFRSGNVDVVTPARQSTDLRARCRAIKSA